MCMHHDHYWFLGHGQQSCPTEDKQRISCAETSKKALNYPTLCWRQAVDISTHLVTYSKDGLGFRVRIFPCLVWGHLNLDHKMNRDREKKPAPLADIKRIHWFSPPSPLVACCVGCWVGREKGSPLSQTGYAHYSSQEKQKPGE